MCVIMAIGETDPRPSDTMLKKAWGRNDDGAGIAYRMFDKAKNKMLVKWKKNLGQEEMEKLCRTVPKPYIAHWRIASCGGILPELTHPFPIDPKASLDLEGETDGFVLFHNGTWGGWDSAAREAAIRRNIKIPSGEWSDTRAIAWLMSFYGNNFMKLLPEQKGVAFGPDSIEVFVGPGWKKINNIWCSNEHFLSFQAKSPLQIAPQIRPMCEYYQCTDSNLDADRRCLKHPKSSFPTNGRPTQTQNKAPEVAKASPTPFPKDNPQGQIISVAVAELMHKQVRSNGSRRCSGNKLKEIKKYHLMMALGGKKARWARETLIRLSTPLLSLSGRQA